MKKTIQLCLSAIALATLAACGGGGGSDPATAPNTPPNMPPNNPPQNANPLGDTASPSVFLPAGATSAIYNLNNCDFSSGSTTTTGGTAVLSITSNGIVTLVGQAQGINVTWDIASSVTSDLEITRSRFGNMNYYFSADNGSDDIQAQYEPSSYATNTPNSSNQVFYSATGRTLTCSYANDPAFAPNFTDYNARIARAIASVTSTTLGTLTQGEAKWDNSSSRTPGWVVLARATGRLSSSATENGQYSEFEIPLNLSSSTNEVSYGEYRTGGLPTFRIFEAGTINQFRFSVGQAGLTELQPEAYLD